MQAVLADWVAYVPNVTWTFTIAGAGASGRKSLDSVVNDTVNVTTKRYVINNMGSGNSLNPALMLSQQAAADVSPPVMAPLYGARNSQTDWVANYWGALKAVLSTWGTNGSTSSDNINCTNVPTGFTYKRYVWLPQQAGGMGLLQATFVTRDPAVATMLATGPFPCDQPVNVLGAGAMIQPQNALLERLVLALEAISLTRTDIAINHGQAIFSVKGGATTG